jgi:hypothetical protein
MMCAAKGTFAVILIALERKHGDDVYSDSGPMVWLVQHISRLSTMHVT